VRHDGVPSTEAKTTGEAAAEVVSSAPDNTKSPTADEPQQVDTAAPSVTETGGPSVSPTPRLAPSVPAAARGVKIESIRAAEKSPDVKAAAMLELGTKGSPPVHSAGAAPNTTHTTPDTAQDSKSHSKVAANGLLTAKTTQTASDGKAGPENVVPDVGSSIHPKKETTAAGTSAHLPDASGKEPTVKATNPVGVPASNDPATTSAAEAAPPVSGISEKHGNETTHPGLAAKSDSATASDMAGAFTIDPASAKHASTTNPAPILSPTDNASAASAVAPPQTSLVEKANTSGAEPTPRAPSAPSGVPTENAPAELPSSGGVQMARLLEKSGQAEMHIGLSTTAFGTVEVHTVVRESQVGLTISSEKGDLRALLSSEVPGLQTTLRQHNLRLDEVKLLQPEQFSGSGSFSQGHPQRRFWQQAPAPAASSAFGIDEQPTEIDPGIPRAPAARTGLNLHA